MNKWTACAAFVALGALAACASGKSSGAASPQPSAADAAATEGSAMKCGAEGPVWALQSPKVYLVPSDRLYGKTKGGHFLCRSDAHAEGFRPARRPFRRPSKD
ncbi:MAG TPA: hypothetical protein VFE16_08185 [Candidatus Cybelea sp.]|nr:hypothetical protein [Candidatus Cybelea sp.]